MGIMIGSSFLGWLLAFILLCFVFNSTPEVPNVGWQYWKSSISNGVIITFFHFLRLFILIVIESLFWGRWLLGFTQQRWAASFYDSTAARRLLSSQGPSILITIPTHIPNFIFGGVLLLCWSFAKQYWMISVGGSLILEPLIKLPVEWGLRHYCDALLDFDSKVKDHWVLMGITGIVFFNVAWVISEGFRSHEFWRIELGLFTLVVCFIWLWIDRQRGYSRWFCGDDDDAADDV
jgi:hypothetical protein